MTIRKGSKTTKSAKKAESEPIQTVVRGSENEISPRNEITPENNQEHEHTKHPQIAPQNSRKSSPRHQQNNSDDESDANVISDSYARIVSQINQQNNLQNTQNTLNISENPSWDELDIIFEGPRPYVWHLI